MDYDITYQTSLNDNDTFWLDIAKTFEWMSLPTKGCEWEWNTAKRKIHHEWFADGILNLSVNCLDRHPPEKTAMIWQGDGKDEVRRFTYLELLEEVCRLANVLKKLGVKKGDRVCLYMGMVPELAIGVLACARIGAVHSVVFGGFSAEALRHRIDDCTPKVLLTCNEAVRGGKCIPLKKIADEAVLHSSVEHQIVFLRTATPCPMFPRDIWYHEAVRDASINCPPEPMNAEDPLFILYTSGSTGKPKGVVHSQAGYLVWCATTHKHVFDIQPDDIYWCTADIGWITGHSYLVYGPLANACTTVVFEGIPTYPDPGRFWHTIEKFHITKFYTAPTAIRALMSCGDHWPLKYDLTSLKVIGTVGEPINPEAWNWYHKLIGRENAPVVDTWWQTETGGIMITPLPNIHTPKPGSASKPFYGVEPTLIDGALCIKRPWPGIMRTTWGDHDRFIDTYFSPYPDVYFSSDGAQVDEDGDYWLMGRLDDVVNIAGHRLGTAEIESALVSHPDIAEAAVVPVPHDIKGQALFAYVTPMLGVQPDPNELINHVREEIGPIAFFQEIRIAEALPKTRSGKIMRRILRKIAEGNTDDLGDISTLADKSVIKKLM